MVDSIIFTLATLPIQDCISVTIVLVGKEECGETLCFPAFFVRMTCYCSLDISPLSTRQGKRLVRGQGIARKTKPEGSRGKALIRRTER